jgi:dipeptidyl aminopeptidase/acylaminoacyl peptidase
MSDMRHDRDVLACLCLGVIMTMSCGGGDGGGGTAPDDTPPAVTLTEPSPGGVAGEISLTADASDAGGVAGVRFLIDGAPLGDEDLSSPYSIAWNSVSAANGTHTLAARARDAAGNEAQSATVEVTVANPVPTGALTVTLTLTGDGTAPGAFTVLIDGAQQGILPGVGAITIESVTAGRRVVSLGALGAYCRATGSASISIDITADQTTETAFSVECVSPPTGRILYQAITFNAPYVFVTVNPDGSEERPVAVEGDQPDWSHDGTRIAYVRSGNIRLMNTDGSGDAELFASAEQESQPAWSPDDTRLLYTRSVGQSHALFVTTVAGPDPQPVFADAVRRTQPTWSPDGSRIAYTAPIDNDIDRVGIWLAGADGTDPALLTGGPFDVTAAWSPDGSRLLFRRQLVSGGQSEIWTVDVDGSNPVNATNHPAFDFDAAWSPDGKWMAFVSERSGAARIWISRVDGSFATPVSSTTYEFTGNPSWRSP